MPVIELPKGPVVETAQIGTRRRVKMIPDMGVLGRNCPILWRASEYDANHNREIIILVSRGPVMIVKGETSDAAYDALPETTVEW